MRAWISLLVGQIEMTLAAAAAAVLGNFSLSFQFSDIASPKAWAFVQWTIITSFRVGQDIRIQIYPDIRQNLLIYRYSYICIRTHKIP